MASLPSLWQRKRSLRVRSIERGAYSNDLTQAQPLPSPPVQPRRVMQRGSCTHITMDRVFGPLQCHICLQYPSMGWLYVCRQDVTGEQTRNTVVDSIVGDGEEEEKSTRALKKELRDVGLSESVITAAERNTFTRMQLEKLKEQKWHLNAIIAAEQQRQQTPTGTRGRSSFIEHVGKQQKQITMAGSKPSGGETEEYENEAIKCRRQIAHFTHTSAYHNNEQPRSSGSSSGDSDTGSSRSRKRSRSRSSSKTSGNSRTTISSDSKKGDNPQTHQQAVAAAATRTTTTAVAVVSQLGQTNTSQVVQLWPSSSPCNFQCCHRCRPYYAGRVYSSIDAVLNGDMRILTPEEACGLPIRSAGVLRSIGTAEKCNTSSSGSNCSSTSGVTNKATGCGSSPAMLLLLPPPPSPTHTHTPVSGDQNSMADSLSTSCTSQSDLRALARPRKVALHFYQQRSHTSTELVRPRRLHRLMQLQKRLQQHHDQYKTKGATETREGERTGFRANLKHVIRQAFSPSADTVSSSLSAKGSSITLPLAMTGQARNLDEDAKEFDLDQLKKTLANYTTVDDDRSNDNHGGGCVDVDVDSSESKSNNSNVAMFNNSHNHYINRNSTNRTITGEIRILGVGDFSTNGGGDDVEKMQGGLIDRDDDGDVVDVMEGDGEQVHVCRGVALTEEAVQTQTPDVITIP